MVISLTTSIQIMCVHIFIIYRNRSEAERPLTKQKISLFCSISNWIWTKETGKIWQCLSIPFSWQLLLQADYPNLCEAYVTHLSVTLGQNDEYVNSESQVATMTRHTTDHLTNGIILSVNGRYQIVTLDTKEIFRNLDCLCNTRENIAQVWT